MMYKIHVKIITTIGFNKQTSKNKQMNVVLCPIKNKTPNKKLIKFYDCNSNWRTHMDVHLEAL